MDQQHRNETRSIPAREVKVFEKSLPGIYEEIGIQYFEQAKPDPDEAKRFRTLTALNLFSLATLAEIEISEHPDFNGDTTTDGIYHSHPLISRIFKLKAVMATETTLEDDLSERFALTKGSSPLKKIQDVGQSVYKWALGQKPEENPAYSQDDIDSEARELERLFRNSYDAFYYLTNQSISHEGIVTGEKLRNIKRTISYILTNKGKSRDHIVILNRLEQIIKEKHSSLRQATKLPKYFRLPTEHSDESWHIPPEFEPAKRFFEDPHFRTDIQVLKAIDNHTDRFKQLLKILSEYLFDDPSLKLSIRRDITWDDALAVGARGHPIELQDILLERFLLTSVAQNSLEKSITEPDPFNKYIYLLARGLYFKYFLKPDILEYPNLEPHEEVDAIRARLQEKNPDLFPNQEFPVPESQNDPVYIAKAVLSLTKYIWKGPSNNPDLFTSIADKSRSDIQVDRIKAIASEIDSEAILTNTQNFLIELETLTKTFRERLGEMHVAQLTYDYIFQSLGSGNQKEKPFHISMYSLSLAIRELLDLVCTFSYPPFKYEVLERDVTEHPHITRARERLSELESYFAIISKELIREERI